jgi:ferredoxin
MTLELSVDPVGCAGHGLCADLLPELIALDDWGYPVVQTAVVPAELAGAARRAASTCPRVALRLRRAAAGRDGGAGASTPAPPPSPSPASPVTRPVTLSARTAT